VREREEALAEAKRLRDEARQQAAERVSAAEQAADEALADARAISSGLRRLGQSLEDYAERILRDVQAGHRRLRGDLRIASGGPASPSEAARGADSERAGGSSRRSRPLDDIDVPEWVRRDE
jgi:signal transduction histidine kinase